MEKKDIRTPITFALTVVLSIFMSTAFAKQATSEMVDRQKIADFIIAIDSTQRSDPASFMVDWSTEPKSGFETSPDSCTHRTIDSAIIGTSRLGEIEFAYELNAIDKTLSIIADNQKIHIDLEKFEPDASTQVTLLPCATPYRRFDLRWWRRSLLCMECSTMQKRAA